MKLLDLLRAIGSVKLFSPVVPTVDEPEELHWQMPKCPQCGATPRMIVRAANLPTRYEPCGHKDFLEELEVPVAQG